ncbi:MAG: 5-formyltetrahydrofolate cyclo-ligase [Crocinitomicaceae bacterium]
MDKVNIRKKYQFKRREVLNSDALSQKIAENLLEKFNFEGQTISVFLPIQKFNEVDTWHLIEHSESLKLNFCIPKMHSATKELQHFIFISKDLLKENSWGIMEPIEGEIKKPTEIDLVIVPLLAYDKKGNRLGYGGGFYDSFLSQCRPNVIKVGVSFFPPEEDELPNEDTDIPLNFCVTPTEIYEF